MNQNEDFEAFAWKYGDDYAGKKMSRAEIRHNVRELEKIRMQHDQRYREKVEARRTWIIVGVIFAFFVIIAAVAVIKTAAC